jgi:predicted AlkP superfamily phosphohydrolase/phosphomutase
MAKGMNTAPLIIFGLDGGDAGFIQRWTQEGYLPTIASIMQRGCWGRIESPELSSTKGAWLSFFSGVSRSEHGYYYDRQLMPGTYDLRSFTARDVQTLPFWAHLRGGAKAVAIVDALETCTVAGVPGLQLANWAIQQQHNRAFTPASAEPLRLVQDVQRRVGRQIHVDVFKPNGSFQDDLEAYRHLLERVEQKGKLCRYVFDRSRPALVVTTFSEAHTAAHRFWNHRFGHRQADAGDDRGELYNAIRDVYQAIDREMGLLIERCQAKSNIAVVSLFGMKDQYPTHDLSEAFCRQLGYQVLSDEASGTTNALARLRRIMPPYWRGRLSRLLPVRIQERLQNEQFRDSTDWRKTTAFALPSLNTSFIRVNLRGREPQGIVEPGSAYASLLNQIEADLKQLVDMRTGEPAIEKVTKTAEAYRSGPPVVLPDLCIEWKSSPCLMERVRHPRAELAQKRPWYNRSSYHSFSGFVAVAGPSIRAGGPIGEVSLLDFAPTFLSLMAEPVPQRLTGRVMNQMIHHSSLKTLAQTMAK